jgi:hypothetical protein
MAAVRLLLVACLVAALRRRVVRLRLLLRLLPEVLAMYQMDLERRHRRLRLFNRRRLAALQCRPMRRFRPMCCDLVRLESALVPPAPQVVSRRLVAVSNRRPVVASRRLVVSHRLVVLVLAVPVAINRRLAAHVQ